MAAKKAPAKKTPPRKTAASKTAGKVAAKKAVAPKKAAPAAKKVATRPAKKAAKPAVKPDPMELAGFPAESIVREQRWLCLACILDIFTRHLGVAAAKAQTEIRRYLPTVEELASPNAARPYFKSVEGAEGCPYCAAPPKWQAPLAIARIEGGKATDAMRRGLVKELEGEDGFYVVEEKATQREALYDWLAKTGAALNPDSSDWLLESARHWLGRRLPKQDWDSIFRDIRAVRRSRRMEDGFEIEAGRLFLAPHLFDEILLAQYLLSRSHKSGGLTFEGRLTLQDLFFRLRGGGYLRAVGVTAGNPSDALEQLMELLGGERGVTFHYIVDRRAFLDRLAGIKDARIPKPKAG